MCKKHPIDEIKITLTINGDVTKLDSREQLLTKFIVLSSCDENDDEGLTELESTQLERLRAHIKESFSSLSIDELKILLL